MSSKLTSKLRVERAYVTPADDAGARFEYDPRFLLFEFTSMLVLRPSQVRLVREFIETVSLDGGSMVKQMIMGAGKTTIILPLLSLFLANGSQLVLQVVPTTLLTFIAVITLVACALELLDMLRQLPDVLTEFAQVLVHGLHRLD